MRLNLGSAIFRELERDHHRRSVSSRLQAEAAARPGAKQVVTPAGPIWMSPIEVQLYDAMRGAGLDPIPQYYIQGYYADFAFPDVHVVVEADGAVHDDLAHKEHDHKRDWILGRAGWTVKRFHGTTIYHRAANCAYIVRKEVEGRRRYLAYQAAERERRRQARRGLLLSPFRYLRRLLRLGGT